ncbi:MAG: hypothetical protein HOP12_15820 [Candidatus Eisenbacteria bacterium]|uniref:Uncharacterized protein n=1 Tax=Eiseniibacteriota bacterium TaxID=2212470 RepID=A0A849SP98_UNCEI|nr:hypothetical protein [Candidatus Eisenbacteria bacterium]
MVWLMGIFVAGFLVWGIIGAFTVVRLIAAWRDVRRERREAARGPRIV